MQIKPFMVCYKITFRGNGRSVEKATVTLLELGIEEVMETFITAIKTTLLAPDEHLEVLIEKEIKPFKRKKKPSGKSGKSSGKRSVKK